MCFSFASLCMSGTLLFRYDIDLECVGHWSWTYYTLIIWSNLKFSVQGYKEFIDKGLKGIQPCSYQPWTLNHYTKDVSQVDSTVHDSNGNGLFKFRNSMMDCGWYICICMPMDWMQGECQDCNRHTHPHTG